MSEPPEIYSPFALLDEVEEAKEVLVLTYTSDLAFFERFALSHARALGAVVTLISDARMVGADPMVVRRAGSAYLDARAVCPGAAFHPKLVVVAGEEQARVAIGSGNLTLAGWHGNAEIWSVLRLDSRAGPQTVSAVAEFLRALLASPIRFGPGVANGLTQVADRLAAFQADGPGPALLHNLEQPILDRLPPGPVDELVVAAPFYDCDLRALRLLVERMRPRRFAVYVEPRTSVDGAELSAFVEAEGGELRWIAAERYHHGKLVQWKVDGIWTALTGSPNLSIAALASRAGVNGNCELALLTEVVDASLPPESGDSQHDPATLHVHGGEEEEVDDVPLLLAAVRDGDAVCLSIDRDLGEAGRAQLYDNALDGWRGIARLEPGDRAYELSAAEAPLGAALRIFFDRGASSNRVFVSDLSRVRLPQPLATGRARKRIELVAELGLERLLLEDLEDLRPHLLRVGALAPNEAPRRETGERTLEDLMAAHEPILGRELTEFALVLPSLQGMGIDADEELEPPDPDLGGEEPGGAAEPEDDRAEPDLATVLRDRAPRERARFRRFLENLIARAAEYPPVVAPLALRALLHGIAAGLWTDEDEPPRLLEEAVLAVVSPAEEPDEEELRAGASLAAVALAMLRAEVSRLSVRDEATLRYERVLVAVRPLLEEVDRERIERLAPELPVPLNGDAAQPAVEELLAEARASAGGADRAVRLLAAEYGIEARVDANGAIVFEQPLPDTPQPLLLRAVGLTDSSGPVVARGRSGGGIEVVACWREPHLALEFRGRGRWGRLYRLGEKMGPLSYCGLDDRLPDPVQRWEFGVEPSAEASELLAEAG